MTERPWIAAGWLVLVCSIAVGRPSSMNAAPAVLLFEDDFNRGIPGWQAVQPAGTYLDGPLRWQYDIVSGAYLEQSNIYTDAAAASPSATAPMLINDAVAGTNFVYKARLIAGDDDAFGLVFGYRDANNFYRVTFTRQRRTDSGYPWNGWNVDRKVNNVATNLFGHGTPDHVESFFNSQYQPFDVTVEVHGNNQLSLTVVDDPEGAAVEHRLVESRPLPGPANGKVGLVTWGMSGTLLRGFRVQSPVLTPVGLAGDPNGLKEWTPVVTQRADGSGLDAGTGNNGRAIWSLAVGATGSYGTLNENSDALGGNDAEGAVDFSAPSLVAGSATWSNYVFTVRTIPADDDGHGILLRYVDERNFYRIALRSQASGTGVRRGLSVQKAVGGVFEEVFREESPLFVPAPNVPYDLTAVMVGDRLQVQVVADVDGAAQVFAYGPFELSGSRLATGRVGLFSWAMSRTEFDFVRVYGLDGVPLQVNSAYGSPEPSSGLHGYQPGTELTARVTSPVEESTGLRRVAEGWTGQGSAPARGSGSSVTFRIEQISSITWNWRTEIRLEVAAGLGGRAVGPGVEWLTAGTNVLVEAVADPGYVFVGWSGDAASLDARLRVVLNRPYRLEARFEPDTDADGLPDSWELRVFGGLGEAASGDRDGDGRTNAEEWVRGSDAVGAEAQVVSDGLVSRWENVQRDPFLPGQLVVRDFGGGYRGVWENSNDFREAVDGRFIGADSVVPGVSFEGPRIVIRTNAWRSSWNDFTASAVFSVGDNDGNCIYFRYQDERNWYRVTVCGENNNLDWRAPFGVTVQKRVNGVFSELAEDASIATDPTDQSFYKRVRVTVTARGSDFEIRVAGWNVRSEPPAWDLGTELVLVLSDPDLGSGRLGVGTWGQSGGATATASNPVAAGALIEEVRVTVGGEEVFREDWSQVALAAGLPEGWSIPATGAAAGTWQATSHGSILQTSNYSTPSTGTTDRPKADGEGAILVAPSPGSSNYLVEMGFHPFDDDGIGFVYDYRDMSNYARVLFVSEADGAGRVPQGLSVSRKVNGVWADIVAGDTSFIYSNGSPFRVQFSSVGGEYRLAAWPLGEEGAIRRWSWRDLVSVETNRFGLTCWGETDAHFEGIRVYRMAAGSPVGDLRIVEVALSGGNLTLEVSNPGGGTYAVETSGTLAPESWTEVAVGQTGPRWTTPVAAGLRAAFYRLRKE